MNAATSAFLGVACAGCLGTGGGGDGDSDADADTDADTDVDSDGDCPVPGEATPFDVVPLGQ